MNDVDRPLLGHRILVTAEIRKGKRLAELLSQHGAVPVELPCISIEPPERPEDLRQATLSIETFDWIVVTSVNGVRSLLESLTLATGHIRIEGPRIAAVGPATAKLLEANRLPVSLVPSSATSTRLLEDLGKEVVKGSRVLLVQGDLADAMLRDSLRKLGGHVSRVTAYRTVEGVRSTDEARRIVSETPPLSAVTLMSGSAARALHEALGQALFERQHFVCIGPATAHVLERCGVELSSVASTHTLEGLVEAVVLKIRGGPKGL